MKYFFVCISSAESCLQTLRVYADRKRSFILGQKKHTFKSFCSRCTFGLMFTSSSGKSTFCLFICPESQQTQLYTCSKKCLQWSSLKIDSISTNLAKTHTSPCVSVLIKRMIFLSLNFLAFSLWGFLFYFFFLF